MFKRTYERELKEMIYCVGRVCVKLSGKETGKYCVILENVDKNFALIEGEVVRKRCNLAHLEPLDVVVQAKKNSDKQEVLGLLEKAGFKVKKKTSKTRAKEKGTRSKRAKVVKKKANVSKKK